MKSLRVERLDHLGLLASVMKDLRLIELIDARLLPDEQEEMTPGEARAGMILNGFGFTNRPVSLTPPFFANTPLDVLLREGVQAAMFNRFKLGRTLAEVDVYGGELLCSALALAVCRQAGIDPRFPHLDTTSFSLSGESVPESDAQAMRIPHGSSKEHRPDLTPAVWERMGSQAGGVPWVRKSWDGNTSETQIFQERAQARIATFHGSPRPRYLGAEAKLYPADNAATLKALGCIPRMPGTLQLVSPVITPALPWDRGQRLDETPRYQERALCHYGMAQRWLVVSSQAA
jgi:transposase